MATVRATFSTSASSLEQGDLDVAGVHLDVAGVDDPEVDQPVGPERQARPGAVVVEVVAHPDRHRTVPRAGSRRRPAVERSTENDNLRVGVRRRVAEIAHGYAQEREVRTEPLR
jgi:hypothetical protein